jgi:hypothetical protein
VKPRTIDMMIVGAPKSGTTSLKTYLGQHPGICAHPQRELIFFGSEEEYGRGYADASRLFFGGARPGQALLGKSVSMMYSTGAMRRLREHNPGVQVVLLLRDPVARAYSEYWYAKRRGRETAETFEAALERHFASNDGNPREPNAYLARGRYIEYLESIWRLFPRSQVNVLLLERFAQNPARGCQELFRRVPGLDDSFVPNVNRRENVAAGTRSELLLRLMSDRRRFGVLRRGVRSLLSYRTRQRIKASLQDLNDRSFTPADIGSEPRERLAAYYAPWNRRLGEALGLGLEEWNRPD